MKVLEPVAALVSVAEFVSGGNPGPSADTCVVKNPGTTQNGMMVNDGKDVVCAAVSNECCAAVKASTHDSKIFPHSEKDGLAMVGKCGRNDQVGLFKCYKVATAPLFKSLAPKEFKLCTSAPAAGEDPDGDGTCGVNLKAMGIGKLQVPGVSTGCCTAIHNVITEGMAMKGMQAKEKAEGKHWRMSEADRAKTMQKVIDTGCGLIGACGRKDQEDIVKFAKGKGKGKGNGGTELLELLAYMPPTKPTSEEFSVMLDLLEYQPPTSAAEEFLETEALEQEPFSQATMASIGFVAGAALTGLGVVALNRRKPTPLEEPLTA